MTHLKVLGVDASLAGTGLATRDRRWQLKTKGQKGDTYTERRARIRVVSSWLVDQVAQQHPDLIVLEAPAPSAVQRISLWDRAKVWWDLVEMAHDEGYPVAFVPPNSVKKFATDNGQCDKIEMVSSAIARLGAVDVTTDNEADAAWLCAMGYHWLGEPLVQLPLTQARAINGVLWPRKDDVLAGAA